MADKNLTDEDLMIFFDDAKTAPDVSQGLMARVLADAADIGALYVAPTPVNAKETGWFSRLFAPIGGVGGAFALGAFASIGLVVGLGDADTLYSLPVMGDFLATFADDLNSVSPLDTLDYLMAES